MKSRNGVAREVLREMIGAAYMAIRSEEFIHDDQEANAIHSEVVAAFAHEGPCDPDGGACAAAMILWLFGFRVKPKQVTR